MLTALIGALLLKPVDSRAQSAAPDYSNVGRAVQAGPTTGASVSGGAGEGYDAFGVSLSSDHPVRVWGETEYELLREGYKNGTAEIYTQNRLSVSLNAATYLIEPWIATLRGGIRLSHADLDDGLRSGNDDFVTGELGLTVFPRSRFPFEAHIETSDSRVGSGLGPDYGYRSTRYGASQRYRSLEQDTRAVVSFDRIEQDGERFGRTVQDLFEVAGSVVPRRHHQIRGMLTHSDTYASERDLRNRYDTFSVRHRYDPSREFWLDSSANLTRTLNEFGQGVVDTRLAQIGSSAFWRPVDSPLSVNGSWRLRSLERESRSIPSEQQYLTGTLGATYLSSPNLRWYGSVDGARTATLADVYERYRLLAGLVYTADVLALGNWNYDRFLNLSVQRVQGNASDRGNAGTAQVGHGLKRNLRTQSGHHYSVSLSQTLGVSGGDNYQSSGLLAHLFSVGWNRSLDNMTGYVRFSLADSRYLGTRRDIFQLANLQANVDFQSGRFATWSGSATLQATRNLVDAGFGSDDAAQLDTGWLRSVSADLTYRRRMLFNVRNLAFLSRLRARRQERIAEFALYGDRERYSWENRLEYLIGRLETQLMFRVAALDEIRRWVLLFRVVRRFGL